MRDRKAARQSELLVDDWERSPVFSDPEVAAAAREKRLARVRLLWERRGLLGRVTGIGILCCIAIAFLISSKYTSTTRLMPPDQEGSSGLGMLAQIFTSSKQGGGLSSGLSGMASNALGLKTTGELFMGILQSRTVEDAIISEFNLRKVYGDRRWQKARSDLESDTNIDDDRKSGIIRISVTDRSPQRAAAIAAAYVTELNRVVTNLNTSSAHRERVFLQGRLQQVQQNLEADEKAFSQFASKNTAIDVPQQGKAMIEAAASLQGQLIAEQTELQSLRSIYTDSNVRVKSMEAQVNSLRKQLQQMGGKGGVADDAGQDNSSLYPSIRQLPILGVTYADLYRRTKVQEAVFETLTQEYEMAKVEEAKETPSVKVLDPANIAEKPSSPNRWLIIFGGGGLCLLAAAAWVLGESKWNHIDSNDPGKLLAQEIFGTTRRQFETLSHRVAKIRVPKPTTETGTSNPAKVAASEIPGNRSAKSVPQPGQQAH